MSINMSRFKAESLGYPYIDSVFIRNRNIINYRQKFVDPPLNACVSEISIYHS